MRRLLRGLRRLTDRLNRGQGRIGDGRCADAGVRDGILLGLTMKHINMNYRKKNGGMKELGGGGTRFRITDELHDQALDRGVRNLI